MYWEVFMTIMFFFALIVIPMDMILNFHNCVAFETPLSVMCFVTDFTCIVDLTCSFLTGYVDEVNKQVILDKKRVIK